MKKLFNLFLLLVLALLINYQTEASVTVMPGSQQTWTMSSAPDSTVVLGQGGTIYSGDTFVDANTGKTYQITTVGSFDSDTQTYTGCEFKEYIFDSNISDFVGINTARTYTTVSSPAFNTSRQPNAARDVYVTASVTLTSVLVGSSMVTPQISADNSTWVSLPAPKQLNLAESNDWPINFVVPAGYYYQLVSSTNGIGASATLNSIQELSN